MLELGDKGIKIVIIMKFAIFKEFNRVVKIFLKSQIKLLKMKTTMSERK